MISQREIVQRKSMEHSGFVNRLARDNLLSRISVDDNGWIKVHKVWKEPVFCTSGIYLEHGLFKRDVVCSPDIVFFGANSQNYLLVVEAKLYHSKSGLEKMLEQLRRDRDYILNFPDHVYNFFSNRGMSDSEIDTSHIGFVGVTPTKYGLHQHAYFGLFDCFDNSFDIAHSL